MKILTISNLFPRPDQPTRGMFNAQLFEALGALVTGRAGSGSAQNICLVPEWRIWRWPAVRRWTSPSPAVLRTRYQPVFYLPGMRSLSAATYTRSLRNELAGLDEAEGILAAWLYPDAVAVSRLAAACRKPLWIMALGSDTFHLRSRCRRKAILDACAGSAGVVCVSRQLAERLTAAGVDAARVYIVPNGVDGKRFRFRPAAEARTALGAAWERLRIEADVAKVVLFVGNLAPVKGPDGLAKAWARLALRHSDTPTLLFIGDGPWHGKLKEQVRKLGIADSVVFLGRRPHDEIPYWMSMADCLCLCSRSEGMPNVILEALASGLPVVATDVGACRDMLAGEPAARVVASQDAEGMAHAIGEILSQQYDRAALAGRHGRRTWSDQAAEILGLMNAVPGGARKAGDPTERY